MPLPEPMNRDAGYHPLSARRRLVVLVLAVTTAVTVVLLLLYPPGGVKRMRPVVPDASRCVPGQSTGCVGGKAEVIVPPATPASADNKPR